MRSLKWDDFLKRSPDDEVRTKTGKEQRRGLGGRERMRWRLERKAALWPAVHQLQSKASAPFVTASHPFCLRSAVAALRGHWAFLFFFFIIVGFFFFFSFTLTLSACCSEAPNQQRSDWEVDVGRPLLPPRGPSGSVTLGFSHCQEAGWMKTLGYWFKGPRKKYISFNCSFNLI